MAPGDNRTGIDDQFNLRKRHPVSRLNLLKNAAQSNWARLVLDCSLDVAYGESSGQRLDIFPGKDRPSPVFIFIHGGYFRALDKSLYRYMARPMAKAGMTTVLVNYDLAPKVTVAEIIRQNLSAFAWIRQNIHRWNGDRERMFLCGHSIG
ncbi:alpha/beta hydrolase [Hoeflea sp.]|uniref:alpha/beta hydrolase n=1 Tax=Hoeflea sp. TaxID=1940281 RepID=UPI003B02A34B